VFVARIPGLISPDYAIFRPVREVNLGYLELLFRSYPMRAKFRSESTGLGTGTAGFLRLYGDSLGAIEIGLPSAEEQSRIVRFVDHANRQIGRYIRAKKKLIALLNEQKQTIVRRTVTRGLDPSVRFEHSRLEWVGDIPAHWRVVALKRVLRRIVDCEHKTAPAVVDSHYRVVRTTGVRHGRLRLHGTYTTTAEAFQAWTRRALPEPGDVVFTREAPAGEACVVPTGIQLCLGQRTVLMKLDRSRYSPQFLVHMIYAGPPAWQIALASQGSTVGHFNMEDIGALTVLAPPLNEQEQIVEYLYTATHELETAEHKTESEISLLIDLRLRLVSDVVTGRIDVREAAAHLPDAAAPSEDEGHLAEEAAESDDAELDDAEAEVTA
jgi:type I restriction enzyme S subunit